LNPEKYDIKSQFTPEKWWLEDEISCWGNFSLFSGDMLDFLGSKLPDLLKLTPSEN